MKYELPFEVIDACRQSFRVRLQDGREAYISNECMFALLSNPKAAYRVVDINDRRGIRPMFWIEVAVFTRGIKMPRRFDCDGNPIR